MNSKIVLKKKKKKKVLLYCVTTARRVPFPILPQAKENLNRLENEGIIEKVTELIFITFLVIKRNGKDRIYVDLKKLNLAVKKLPNLDISPELNGTIFCFLNQLLPADSTKFFQVKKAIYSRLSLLLLKDIAPEDFGITSALEIFKKHVKINEKYSRSLNNYRRCSNLRQNYRRTQRKTKDFSSNITKSRTQIKMRIQKETTRIFWTHNFRRRKSTRQGKTKSLSGFICTYKFK